MNENYHITIKDGVTIIRFSENPSFDLVKSIMDELAKKELYKFRLWDLRTIGFDWSTEMLRAMADYGIGKFPKPNKVAFLVDSDLAFGEIRIFMVYREEGKLSQNVFRDYNEAIEYLKAQSMP